jgi:hypothetical protein
VGCARINTNIGSPQQFQQAQRVGDFFVSPSVVNHYGDAEQIHIGRLKEYHQGSHVGAAGTHRILIGDNHVRLRVRDRTRAP